MVVVEAVVVEAMVPMVPPTQLLQGPRDLSLVEAPAAVLVLAAQELLHAGPALLSHALHEAGSLLRLDLPVTIRVHARERLLSRLLGAHLLRTTLGLGTALLR